MRAFKIVKRTFLNGELNFLGKTKKKKRKRKRNVSPKLLSEK